MNPTSLPAEQRQRLLGGEKPFHFAYISSKGGCADSSSASQWILVTDRRILFEASVRDGPEKYSNQSGSIPMAKVSYSGVSATEKSEGCSETKVYNLLINSSGGEIVLAVPTQEEAQRIQGVIDAVLQDG